MKCPHCGKEFNAGKLMGSVKSERKAAASRKNGASMKAIIQAGKAALGVSSNGRITDFDSAGVGSIPAAPAIQKDEKRAMFEALKAKLAGGGKLSDLTEPVRLLDPQGQPNMPCAPFDVNLEGEPHRVVRLGSKLALQYTGAGEPVFSRYLRPGELETFWEARIK